MNASVFSRFLAVVVLLSATVACGNDIEPTRDIYDANGEIFLENGTRAKATTSFTTAQLRSALTEQRWVRDYAFYYDKGKAGRRNEMSFAGTYYYTFLADGTATMTNADNAREVYHYTYSVEGREVTLVSSSSGEHLLMRVVALDPRRLVADTPVPDTEIPAIYDATTVRIRVVFRPYTAE